MQRLKCTVQYLGTGYHGFNGHISTNVMGYGATSTVQSVLEQAFARCAGKDSFIYNITPGVATDVGVHAEKNVSACLYNMAMSISLSVCVSHYT